MAKARKINKVTSYQVEKPEVSEQPKPAFGQITAAPSRIIERDRSVSSHIVDTLAKTALAISGAENAAEKLNVIQSLWNMQKEAENRQAEREFNTAKVLLARDMPPIPRTGKREFIDKSNQKQSSAYSTLDDIEGVLDPVCRDYGITKEYSSETDARGWARQVLTVRHVSGHKEVYYSPYMPLDSSGSKNNNQGAGSTAKYGRRYALIGAFNIFHVDEDTDGINQEPAAKTDKFAERVQADIPTKASPPLTLQEAADALERRIRNLPVEGRAACWAKHSKVTQAMEADSLMMAERYAELRALCQVEVSGE